MDRKGYLEVLEEQIRCKKAIPFIQKELEDHIEDQKMAYLASGMTEYEAEEAAVEQMGDPVAAGMELDRVHRPKMAWGMIVLAGALYFAGFLVRFLVEAALGVDFLSAKVGASYLFSFMIMIGVCFWDYSRIGKWARELTILASVVLVLGIGFGGNVINGSSGWVSLGGIATVNVRILIFLMIPLYAAVLYQYRGQGYGSIGRGILWTVPLVLPAIACRSFSLVLWMMLLCLLILVYAVSKGWYQVKKKRTIGGLVLIGCLLPSLSVGYLWVFGATYQKERVLAILSPFHSETNETVRFFRTVVSDSRFVGGSTEAINMLASGERTEDLLTYLLSFYGILVTVLLVGMMAVLLGVLFHHAARQKNQLGRMMGFACMVVLARQILVYTAGCLGLIMPQNVYCPFLGSGGSGALMTGVLLGILLSIYRYQNVISDVKIRKKSRQQTTE